MYNSSVASALLNKLSNQFNGNAFVLIHMLDGQEMTMFSSLSTESDVDDNSTHSDLQSSRIFTENLMLTKQQQDPYVCKIL